MQRPVPAAQDDNHNTAGPRPLPSQQSAVIDVSWRQEGPRPHQQQSTTSSRRQVMAASVPHAAASASGTGRQSQHSRSAPTPQSAISGHRRELETGGPTPAAADVSISRISAHPAVSNQHPGSVTIDGTTSIRWTRVPATVTSPSVPLGRRSLRRQSTRSFHAGQWSGCPSLVVQAPASRTGEQAEPSRVAITSPNSQTVAGSQRPATGRAPIEATASAAATSSGSTGTQRPDRNAASRPPAAGGAPALGEHGQPARPCLPWSASVDDHASARGSSRWGCGGRKWLRGMSDRRATDPGVSGQDGHSIW